MRVVREGCVRGRMSVGVMGGVVVVSYEEEQ